MIETISCVCPECGDINEHKFIHDLETFEQYGFIASKTHPAETSDEEWAPNGLCPSTTCIDEWCTKRNLDSRFKMGIPLIEKESEQSNVVEQRYESTEDCNDCNVGRFYYNTSTNHYQCNNPFCSAERDDCFLMNPTYNQIKSLETRIQIQRQLCQCNEIPSRSCGPSLLYAGT